MKRTAQAPAIPVQTLDGRTLLPGQNSLTRRGNHGDHRVEAKLTWEGEGRLSGSAKFVGCLQVYLLAFEWGTFSFQLWNISGNL